MTTFLTVSSILVGLILVFLILISPSDRKHPKIGMLRGAYIAHRGLHDKSKSIPENSLSAFEQALKHGFPIEIDIHLTKDNKVVVFHDEKLERMCGSEGSVEEKTLEELRTLRLLDSDEKIPTLEETLNLVNGKQFLLIEFKVKNNAKQLCRAASEILSQYKGDYFVQSFYPQVLGWYKFHNRTVCRGLLAAKFQNEGLAKRLLGNMLLNFIAKPDFIAYKLEDSDALMRRLVVWLGAESLGWTFRSAKTLEEKKRHFNGFIFENFLPEKE